MKIVRFCLFCLVFFFFFFFNDTATTEIYTLSLHDALPISFVRTAEAKGLSPFRVTRRHVARNAVIPVRSEEHTSELQSRLHLVCRLLLEKKKQKDNVLNLSHLTQKQEPGQLRDDSITATAL